MCCGGDVAWYIPCTNVVKKWWASNYYMKNRQAKRERCMSETKVVTCKAPKLGTHTRDGKIHLLGRRVPGLPIRDCTGSSNNQACPNVPQTERNRCDSKGNLCLFIWFHVGKQLGRFVTIPSAPTPPPITLRLFFDFRAIIFPECSSESIFLVSTIRQVIWPSPGTLLGRSLFLFVCLLV